MSATLLGPAPSSRLSFPSNRSGAHEVRSRDARVRTLRIALLGCGTVGSCLAATLIRERCRLAAETGVDFEIARILVRHPQITRPVPRELVTDRFEDVLEEQPDVVVELLGGLEPAASHVQRALEAGIPVVTANKTVIAHHGPALAALARRRGVQLLYEAAVCAAVPILSVLEQLGGDRIRSIHGILNGSTNYVLTRMSSQPLTLSEALIEAKDRGLIEPDPAADLSGRDAAEKLAILAREAGFQGIDYGSIDVAGIEHVTADDILAARKGGCVIKLVAELERGDGCEKGVSLRVGPTLVPRSHRLASVDHARNAVVIDADLGGEVAIEGIGAGPRPTSSALIGDLLRVARLIRGGGIKPAHHGDDATGTDVGAGSGLADTAAASISRPHYVRIQVRAGLQSPQEVIEAFRSEGVAIKSIDFRAGTARVWTLPATTEAIRAAVAKISAGDDVLIAPMLDSSSSSSARHNSSISDQRHPWAPRDGQHHAVIHLVQRRLSA